MSDRTVQINYLIRQNDELRTALADAQSKLEVAVSALKEISMFRATTIFIEDEKHVNHFFKPVDEALAKIEGKG